MTRPEPSSDETCSAGHASHPVSPDVAAARAVAIAAAVAETETIDLIDAQGRVLAADIASPMAVPPFDNSAMDGYAVRLADLAGDGPWTLPIVGRVAAGESMRAPAAGGHEALRIFTGAPVPDGFDAVVMQEHCKRDGDQVIISGKRPRMGENIRRAGEDVERGALLASSGEALSPQRLALLAGAGVASVSLFRKVRIGLISTGSELREPGEALMPGQIYNSNRVVLRAMLSRLSWAQIEDFGIVPDDRPLLERTLEDAALACDVVVTTGGVSAGDEDHVAAIMRDGGTPLEVVKVAMRPGKPVKVGRLGQSVFFGLPGNPNAALVTFRQIALPAIRTVAGLRDVVPVWQPAVAGFGYARKGARTEFVPVRIAGRTDAGVPVVEMLGRGSSANLSAMAAADGIALLPPEDETISPGMPLRYEAFRMP
jgi:molybdopterin molybdotransferase